jgi:hypothetical protein
MYANKCYSNPIEEREALIAERSEIILILENCSSKLSDDDIEYFTEKLNMLNVRGTELDKELKPWVF